MRQKRGTFLRAARDGPSGPRGAGQVFMSAFRFVFVAFSFAAILILAVHLREVNSRLFYRLCSLKAEQNRLKQQLWQKQLRVESLINPAAISQRLGEM